MAKKKRTYRTWTDKDQKTLVMLEGKGMSTAAIAREMKRSISMIRAKRTDGLAQPLIAVSMTEVPRETVLRERVMAAEISLKDAYRALGEYLYGNGTQQ